MILKLEIKPRAALAEWSLSEGPWGLLKVHICAEYPLLGIFPKEAIREMSKMLTRSE